jgi:hypothetical protein
MPRAARDTPGHASGRSVTLKPADPFELVRLLARSQSDPRKAVAELVQNSLDAGARQVVIERLRQRGVLTLIVRDDGEGVLPDLDREAALDHIATNIGHSRKLGLNASERAARVVAGKYGVGLLGFWAIGGQMELRSRVGGSELLALRMQEDSPQARIVRLPLRLDAPATFTEVVIAPVHDVAQKALGGRRLSDYLASELRGQLLQRGVRVLVRDRIARGTAQKEFPVVPQRFSGERLALPDELEVPGHAPLRVELYQARGAERPAVQVACAGTVVADDLADLAALGLAGEPWSGCSLVGLVDFASFNVPPGTRRGVAPDRAALAFVEAMERLRPQVLAELQRLEEQRRAAIDREIVRELQRALRGLRRRLPQYDLPAVGGDDLGAKEPGSAPGASLPDGSGTPPAAAAEPLEMFPPGPVAGARIVPERVLVAPAAERRVSAVTTDSAGRRTRAALRWRLLDDASGTLTLRGEGARPAIVAAPHARLGATGELELVATDPADPARSARAVAAIVVAEDERAGETLGVPEPQLVSDPDGRWRSRMPGERWEVNDAHPDYVALRGEQRVRVRYLLALLAKEIVIRTTGRVDAADLLESLVELLAHAERNLRGG